MNSVVIVEPCSTAGEYLAQRASTLGWKVIGITQHNVFEEHYGKTLKANLDLVEFVNFANTTETVLKVAQVARKTCAAAIVAGFEFTSDIAVLAADAVGLPTNVPSFARYLRDKKEMNSRFVECGVLAAETIMVNSVAEAVAAGASLGFPVVVKPRSNAGSCGVSLVVKQSDIAHAVHLAQSFTVEFPHGFQLPSDVLVQEYIAGSEYSVESVSVNGMFHVLAITEKHMGEPPYFAKIGHILPAPLRAEEFANIADTAARAVAAVGIRNGVAHTEVRIGINGSVVMEVAGRLAGDHIPELLDLALGIDQAACYLNAAAGLPICLDVQRSSFAGILFFTAQAGGIVHEIHPEYIECIPFAGSASFTSYVAVGDRVEKPSDNIGRLGHVICNAETYDEIVEYQKKCRQVAVYSMLEEN